MVNKYIVRYLTSLIILFAADALWLGVIAKDFFLRNLGPVVPLSLSVLPALFFYLLFAAAIVFFCVNPAIKKGSLKTAWLRGVFFGLVTYGAYDLTNQATIKGWPWIVTALDMCWGSFLAAWVSAVTYIVVRPQKKSDDFLK